MIANKVYTCSEAADALGVTGGRVRQICMEHKDIGRKHGRSWMFTDEDIRRIREIKQNRRNSKVTVDF